MEIYIRVHSDDGSVAWWNHDKNGKSYLIDGKDLLCTDGPYDDYLIGTPFTSVAQAKHEARAAIGIARFDGMVDPKATFWRYANGKLVQIKFTRDGKLKKY